ncbi:uncharacterized protein PG986_011282 [Apiospora aurea]|uniref:Uncharacterized protein n=1 Tax=Apiospora aurea TaxID=335848 RepID=A0ABR1Q548_9PEZI
MHPSQPGPVEAVFELGAGTFPDVSSGSGTTLFHYSNGPAKVPTPWKRGRPRGGAKKTPRKDPAGFQFVNLTAGKSSAVVQKDVTRTSARTTKNAPNVSNTSNVLATANQSKPEAPRQVVSRLNLHQIQGVDPFGQAPITLGPYMLDLLRYYAETAWRNFYTLEDLAGKNPVSEFWMPRAFQDPALIHTFVGCSVAHAYGYHAIAFQNRGLRHLQDAISVVKRRLDIPAATFSSTTLAVIAAIAMLEKGAGRHENWAVHMQGLRDLVDHRGGREALASEPLILHKIYRADLFGCLDTGQRSWLSGPTTLPFDAQPAAPVGSEGFTDLFETTDICSPLRNCVRELETLVSFWPVPDTTRSGATLLPDDNGLADVTSRPGGVKPTAAQAKHTRDVLTEVQYALVSDAVLEHCRQDTYEGRLNSFCRVVLVVYSLTLLHEPTPYYTLGRRIGRVFRRAYSDAMLGPGPQSPIPKDFCIWALFLAAAAMEGTECDSNAWIQAMFAQLVMEEEEEFLGDDCARMKGRLRRYLWIPCLHDASFQRLWQGSFLVTEINTI